MNIDFFLSKFGPLNNWCVGFMEDGSGNRCALGHCKSVEEQGALETIFKRHYADMNTGVQVRPNMMITAQINDGLNAFIDFGDTPHERIMFALRRAKMEEELEELERRTTEAMKMLEVERENMHYVYRGDLVW